MKTIGLLVLFFLNFLITHSQKGGTDLIIAKGQMPNIAKDKNNDIHIVYGSGDNIMYIFSKDGRSFSTPTLVAVLPELFASAMRGPQIAAGANGLVVTACTKAGNIFSYNKKASGKWTKAVRVNDEDESAKEALMSLSADGANTFAVWLGVRNPKGQNIIGAKSNDGGKTWKKNILVYASPDNSVCECCKPSVVMKGNNVYAMFRNWLNGNRDLYLIKSTNGGNSFGVAQKLGNGSWTLKGCPMDGGGLTINKYGIPETVWRREGKIYASTPGLSEKEIGEGRSCSMETINNKKIYTWTESGNIIVMKPTGTKINLGKGSSPLVKAFKNDHVVCVWENEKQIHAAILEL
ncbi:MAG TPA: sialidase family protein [Chitinophagaceae bacterium]|nr:sialidase family protein [Chitinophagaceae bacterium]